MGDGDEVEGRGGPSEEEVEGAGTGSSVQWGKRE